MKELKRDLKKLDKEEQKEISEINHRYNSYKEVAIEMFNEEQKKIVKKELDLCDEKTFLKTRKEIVKKLRSRGFTYRTIGDYLDVTRSRVWQILFRERKKFSTVKGVDK